MTERLFRIPAAFFFGTLLLATSTVAQTHPAAPESPYGGTTVEEIVARVNDQIITRSDYDRAMKELDAEARDHGASMQEISAAHKDLLRNLIDQQLWLSKGKELSINGETELIQRLNELRKQYNLETLEDLEKAAKQQGVSYEDFKASIRNGIITQLVMRQEVGRRVQITPGEVQRYFEAHKQEYAQPESVHLSEILVSAAPAVAPAIPGVAPTVDPAVLAAAKAKADDIEARLHAGGDFSQLAKNFSDGPTAAEGGDLGQFQRGSLAKVLEDATFALKTGQVTEPIHTRQGYVILKVVQHVPGGVPEFKDVEQQVEDTYFTSRMEPAMRDYLTTMREEAYIDYDTKRFVDTGASPKQIKPVFSAYTPPSPKKKKKVERTRFRESTRTYRQKTPQAVAEAAPPPQEKGNKKNVKVTTQKPGKRERVRYGQAPSKTLPSAPQAATEDAGAVQQASNNAPEPVNPLEQSTAPDKKTRFSERTKQPKQPKAKTKGPKIDKQAPAAPDAAEVADRQTQAAPLGLAGDTSAKKKTKQATTTGEKTRLTDKKKKEKQEAPAPPAASPSASAPQPDSSPSAPAPQTSTPAPQQ
jgi:peptidyl-prolyl cis-trans isomerase SurA